MEDVATLKKRVLEWCADRVWSDLMLNTPFQRKLLNMHINCGIDWFLQNAVDLVDEEILLRGSIYQTITYFFRDGSSSSKSTLYGFIDVKDHETVSIYKKCETYKINQRQ